MILAALDFETTGLLPEKHGVSEVGAVLWDTDLKAPVRVEGFLVDPGDDVEWDEQAIQITGITKELVATHGIDADDALSRILFMFDKADFIVAHNGTVFDRPVFDAWCKRAKVAVREKTWIDTRTDIEYPAKIVTRQLTYIAAEHGILNFFGHRAVNDVLTMLQILSRYDIDRVVYLAKQPVISVMAHVSYDDKQLAKDRGYYWALPRPDARKEVWQKQIKQCFLEQEQKEAGFPVVVFEKR